MMLCAKVGDYRALKVGDYRALWKGVSTGEEQSPNRDLESCT